MSDKRQFIPIGGFIATIAVAGYMVAQLHAQQAATSGDFTSATIAEVQDAQGQIILRGQFAAAEEEDDDVERKAALEPTGVDADASGDAEVEFARTTPTEQEVEFSVRNVTAGAVLNVLIDGQVIGQITADRRGRAEFDRDIPIAGAAAAR